MLKNFFSYIKYMLKLQKKKTFILIVDSVAFVASLIALLNNGREMLPNLRGNLAIMVIIVISFVKAIYDCYIIIGEAKTYLNLRYGEIFHEQIDFNQVNLDRFEKQLGYKIIECTSNINKNGFILSSPEIDKYIRENSLEIQNSKSKRKAVRKFIELEKENLLPFLKWQYRHSMFYGKQFFNEKKLCLSNDIIPNDKKYVYCHKGTYYDSFLTNVISGKQLKSNQDDSIIANAEEYFPIIENENGEILLKNLTSSIMNNEIGISTIGITSDNYLVLWTQNRAAQSSNGLLVSTGSGSCNWNDKKNNNFNEAIIHAMKRELWEESGKRKLGCVAKDVGETKILGFFRWIVNGGKPEFVGITKMKSDLISLYANKSEVYGKKEYQITKIEDVEIIIDQILKNPNVSVPLYMNLMCLKEYYDSNKKELEEFILT